MNRFALTALAATLATTTLAGPADAGVLGKLKKKARKARIAAIVDGALEAATEADVELEAFLEAMGVEPGAEAADDAQPIAPPPPFTHTVCAADCDFTSIQDAIDAADSGERISIAPAVYAENLTIARSVILMRSGSQKVVIQGDGENPVLTVDVGAVVSINGLDFSDGGGIAGILNLGELRLTGALVSGHGADYGALFNGGSIHVERCTVMDNVGVNYSGGITNYGTALIEDSSFTGNNGYLGGGAANVFGTMTLRDSSLSTNHATSIGGGWSNHNLDGEVIVEGTGLAANSSGSGLYDDCYDVHGNGTCDQ